MTHEEKQIEEIAKEICPLFETYGECETCDAVLDIGDDTCVHKNIASLIIAHGYRKASEVAEEVINRLSSKVQIMMSALNCEIAEKPVPVSEFNKGARATLETIFKDLAELKKKYTEEGK